MDIELSRAERVERIKKIAEEVFGKKKEDKEDDSVTP